MIATLRVRVTALPSAEVAVTTICHFPADRSSGVSKVPSAPTFTVVGPMTGPAGSAGGADAPGDADGSGDAVGAWVAIGVPSAVAVMTALIDTVTAFDVVPRTGMAPFSNWAPSAGDSTVSVGASMT